MPFFRPTFLAASPFVIFSKWADSSLSGWKIPNHLPSWSTFLRSPRHQASFHEMLIPKSSVFFWTIGGWWDMPIFVPFVHEHAPLSSPNPNWSLFAFLEDSRFLGVLRYPGPIPFWAPQEIFLIKAGMNFLFHFPFFSKTQSLSIRRFGHPFAYFKWALVGGLGLTCLWGPNWVLDSNICDVLGPNTILVIFWTSTFSPPSLWVACSPCISKQDFGLPKALWLVLLFPSGSFLVSSSVLIPRIPLLL